MIGIFLRKVVDFVKSTSDRRYPEDIFYIATHLQFSKGKQQ